jgi:hypothetical protein
MADVTKEIVLKVSATDATGPALESLEDKLNAAKKRMVELAAAGKQNTEEFQRLQVEAGGYKRTIEGVEQSVDSFAKGGTKALTLMVQASQAVAAGFQVAQGAAALFGDENEDLQKAMLKVQGAIALANGVQQVANLLQKESALVMGINTLATKTYAAVVGDATEKTRIFRIALAGLGLTGIIVILGLIAEALGLFSQKTKDATDSQKDFKRSLEDTDGTLEYYERKLKANGATEADLAKLRRQTLLNEKAELERKLKEDVARFGVKNDKYQNSLRQELDLLNIKIKEESKIIDDAAKQESDKATQTANELLAIQKKYQDQLALLNADGLRRESLAIDQKYEADLAKLKKHGKDTADLEAVIRQEKLQKEREFGIQLRNVQQEYADKQKEAADKQEQDDIARMQREGARRTAFANSQTEGQKKKNQDELQQESDLRQAQQQMADQSFSIIGDIITATAGQSEEAQRKAFNVSKAASIAQAIVNTYLAANAALKTQIEVFPGQRFVQAGLAIAAGLANVAKIRATQFKGGGSNTSNTAAPSGGASTATPAATFTNPQTTNLGTGELSGGQSQQNQPMRAYVVERDIQQTTSRVRRLSEFATLG